MTKVRLSLVALGLEHMVVFVFALPPPPARLHNRRDVLSRDAVMGEKAVVVEWCARGGVDHRDLEPMDRHGILPVAQEHVMAHAIQGHCRAAAMPVTAFTRGDAIVGWPKGDALGQLGRGIGLAHQDAIAALCQRQGTPGLRAVQLITQYGHLMRRQHRGLCLYPAWAGPLLTVLFGMAIVRHAVLWREGDDL